MQEKDRIYILSNINKMRVKDIARETGISEHSIRRFIEKEYGRRKTARPVEEKKSVPGKKAAIAVLVIIVLGAAVYANSLGGKFLYDDEYLIKNNLYLKKPSYIPNIFSENIISGAAMQGSFYRPLQMLTYMADYSLWKLNPFGYHVTSVILHILAGLCVFWLAEILFNDRAVSFLTGIFFIAHPIHTGVVSYISTRADLLMLLFVLLSFIFYIKNSDRAGPLAYTIMISCYALALLSKESSLNLLALVLLYHFVFRKKIRYGPFLALCCVALVYILIRMTVLRHLLPDTAAYATTLIQRLPGFFVALIDYLRLLVLPIGLHAEYGSGLFRFSDPRAISGMMALAGLLFAAFKLKNKNALVSFSILLFLITLFPNSNIYPINAYMSENWMYLPSIGFFLIVSYYLARIYRKESLGRPLRAALIIVPLAFYAVLTARQNGYWKDGINFYETTLRYSPDNAKILNSLGNSYAQIGEMEKAMSSYKKAIEIDPGYANVYNNIGKIMQNLGKKDEAIDFYKKAIKACPDNAVMHANLGSLYLETGRQNEAVASLRRAIEINPRAIDAYNNLAVIYANNGRFDEAIKLYLKVIDMNPEYAPAYNNLGAAYFKTKDIKESIDYYRKAVEKNPVFTEAYTNLGMAYNSSGQREKAIEAYRKALEINPDYAPARNQLAEIYSADRRKAADKQTAK